MRKSIISFDFDGTLANNKFAQLSYQKLSFDISNEIHIVTQRFGPEEGNGEWEEVSALAVRLGIPNERIHFCNRQDKYHTINRIGAHIHFDDDHEQCLKIRQYSLCIPILVV